VCCHLCGRWYVSLGAHVRVHGHTAETYRQAMGLCATQPLTSSPLSAVISRRQTDGYRRDPELRARLDAGRQSLLRAPRPAKPPDSREPMQRQRRRAAALAAGRRTVAVHREQELTRRLEQWGHGTLHDFLRCAYSDGASLDELARQTGLGRARLRQELRAAGIDVRATGSNTAAGKRSRARMHNAAAAQRVGADDITSWLAERTLEGWSLSRLAVAVGHSSPWVRARLSAVPATPSRANTHSGIAR
ncbi:MAG: hypothetical protein WA880_02795, partial [Ornithinimicrobium sp.]